MRDGLKSILHIFLKHRWRVALGAVCLFGVDAGQLAIPPIVGRAIDEVASKNADSAWLGRVALLLMALGVVIFLFRFAWRHLFFVTARKAELDLRAKIFDRAIAMSIQQSRAISTGEVMAIATNDVESVRRALAMGIVAGVDAFVFSAIAIGAMLWLSPSVTMWVVLPLPLLALVMRVTMREVYRRWDQVQSSFESMTERSRESVAGIRLIKAFDLVDADERRFGNSSKKYFEKYMGYLKVDAFIRPAIMVITGMCIAILLGVGGKMVILGTLSIGTFVALTTYVSMLTWPMIAAGWMVILLQRSSASMERIELFLHREIEPGAEVAQKELFDGDIEFKDLHFSYGDDTTESIDGVSLKVPKGTKLGVVGQVGSGKSTLVRLFLRLEEPPSGSVFIAGKDIISSNLKTLRRSIAWVPQEAFLFSDTIEANLRVGKPDASMDELVRVCKLASIHDEIISFAEGYTTVLGERGITLSGGQKQRLCLARALLKDAPFIVLDDTLSEVDGDTQRAIIRAMVGELKEKTAIVVSHRVSAVMDLDAIAVFSAGRIVQYGTHEELLEQDGYYRSMVRLQSMSEGQ